MHCMLHLHCESACNACCTCIGRPSALHVAHTFGGRVRCMLHLHWEAACAACCTQIRRPRALHVDCESACSACCTFTGRPCALHACIGRPRALHVAHTLGGRVHCIFHLHCESACSACCTYFGRPRALLVVPALGGRVHCVVHTLGGRVRCMLHTRWEAACMQCTRPPIYVPPNVRATCNACGRPMYVQHAAHAASPCVCMRVLKPAKAAPCFPHLIGSSSVAGSRT